MAAAQPGHADAAKTVTLAMQPLSLSAGFIAEVVTHDLILRDDLAKLGYTLRCQPFKQGHQMIAPLQQHQIDVAVMGDQPAMLSVAEANATVVGMIGIPYTSIIGPSGMTLNDLAGKRIAVAPDSVASYAVVRALHAAQLQEKDVRLVPMQVDEMLAAMEQGRIDVFASWEPFPKIALTRHPEYAAIFRSVDSSFLVFSDALLQQQPEPARLIMAAFARALRWVTADLRNLDRAVLWSFQTSTKYDGKAPQTTLEQSADLARESVADVVGLPLLSREWISDHGAGERQFDHLQQIGQLPPTAHWEQIQQKMNRTLMQAILADPAGNQIDEYRYQ